MQLALIPVRLADLNRKRNRIMRNVLLALLPGFLGNLAAQPLSFFDPNDKTTINIDSSTPADQALPSTCHGITITITVTHTPPSGAKTTGTASVTVEPGDSRKDLTQRLWQELKEVLPNAKIDKGDTTITIFDTDGSEPENSGTEGDPKKSPPDGDSSRVYGSQETSSL